MFQDWNFSHFPVDPYIFHASLIPMNMSLSIFDFNWELCRSREKGVFLLVFLLCYFLEPYFYFASSMIFPKGLFKDTAILRLILRYHHNLYLHEKGRKGYTVFWPTCLGLSCYHNERPWILHGCLKGSFKLSWKYNKANEIWKMALIGVESLPIFSIKLSFQIY